MPVTFKDMGLGMLLNNLKMLGKLKAVAGVGADGSNPKYPDGEFVATIFRHQEFGTKMNGKEHVPQRSVMRSTMFEQRDAIANVAAKSMADMVNTRIKFGPISATAAVAKDVAERFDRKVLRTREWADRNRPSTIRAKGFNYPLHHTWKLARSLSWAARTTSNDTVRSGKV